MKKYFEEIIDSEPVVIVFAVWTGVYLWQVVNGEEGTSVNQFLWIIAGFGLGILFF